MSDARGRCDEMAMGGERKEKKGKKKGKWKEVKVQDKIKVEDKDIWCVGESGKSGLSGGDGWFIYKSEAALMSTGAIDQIRRMLCDQLRYKVNHSPWPLRMGGDCSTVVRVEQGPPFRHVETFSIDLTEHGTGNNEWTAESR